MSVQGAREKISNEQRRWLEKVASDGRGAHGSTGHEHRDLLRRASSCYSRAGWRGDARRVSELVGDFRAVAHLYEQDQLWQEAASVYQRLGDHRSAARCFLRANLAGEAAEILMQGDIVAEAAWIWAHVAEDFERAEQAADRLDPDTPEGHVASLLVLSRCAAGRDDPVSAGRFLRQAIDRLSQESRGPTEFRAPLLRAWAGEICDRLGRTDLHVLIHAIAVSLRDPNGKREWTEWARVVFDGDESSFWLGLDDDELSVEPLYPSESQ